MDIDGFRDRMRDKYAEQERHHGFRMIFRWYLILLAAVVLGFCSMVATYWYMTR